MSYLQRLAQVFAHEVGNELSEYTFVFPNRRAGLFFRRYLGQALDKPIFSPRVMTINECFRSLSELRVADQLTLVMRLYTLYCDLRPNPDPLEQFLHWGKMMLADFSEIDNHLVSNVEALYEAVQDIHEIDNHFLSLTDTQRNAIKKFWGDFYAAIDKNDNQLHHRFIRTWELLYPLYQGLRDSLLSDQLAYEGLLHRHVLEHWHQIPDSAFEQHYVFVGFNALTESERQLLIHLRDRGCADFYFDYEDTYLSDSVVNYIVNLIAATRQNEQILRGASPRATLATIAMAKALAQLRGRDYVLPEDIKEVFVPTITHRLLLSPKAEGAGKTAGQVLQDILAAVDAPKLN